MSEELKPRPVCGSSEVEKHWHEIQFSVGRTEIHCKSCLSVIACDVAWYNAMPRQVTDEQIAAGLLGHVRKYYPDDAMSISAAMITRFRNDAGL